MKRKNIISLLAILGLLLIVGGIRQLSQPPSRGLQSEAKLVAVVEGIAKPDVTRLELFAGAKPDEKVVLEFDSESNTWHSPSYFNAPINESLVSKFIEDIVGLQGEFRSEATDAVDLEKYDLSDETALHIYGYTKDSEEPAFKILAGKSPKYQTAFLRKAENNSVLLVDTDLRNEAGIFSSETQQPPQAGKWLDKSIVNLEKGDIRTVDLTTPDRHLRFEYKEFVVEDEPAETAESEGDDSEPPEPKKEFKWIVASGGPGVDHKQTGLNGLLSKLDTFTATDIVDPEKKDEWGLEPPQFKCIVSIEGLEDDVIIEGGHPDADKSGYIRIANTTNDVVYKVSKYSFEQLFPKGNALFDLPSLGLLAADVTNIDITQPEGKVSLVREDDEWKVVTPAADFNVAKSKIETIARTLATWRASDYADEPADPGFEGDTGKAVTFQAGEESHTLRVGAKNGRGDGFYTRLDKDDAILAIGNADVAKIFVTPSDLYERALYEIDSEDLVRVKIERPTDAFVLEKGDDEWTLLIESESSKTQEDPVDDILWALEGLQASALTFTDWIESPDEEAYATLTFTTANGETFTLNIENEKDGSHAARLSGKKTPFRLSAEDVSEILPASSDLKIPEPPIENTESQEEQGEAEPEEQEETIDEHDHDLDEVDD